jgi:hypothetical protein
MVKGDSDGLSTVLEDVDVTHVRQATELLCTVAPYLDQILDVLDTLFAKRRVVHGRVAHDLTAALVACV